MKSLEKEIKLSAPAPTMVEAEPDIGFGALDDELGLPSAPVSSEEDDEDVEVVSGSMEAKGGGYRDQIWGLMMRSLMEGYGLG